MDKDKDAVFRDAEIAPACPAEACRQGEETTQPGPSPRSRMETFDWRMMRVYKFAKDGTKRSNNIEPLLREYARMGKKRCRLARFLFGASLAMLFCVALLAGLDDYPNSPCRGAVTYWTVWILTYGALVAFLGIVFFVIDAMHLCQYFVRALGDDKHVRSEPRHRPDSPGQQSCRGLELAAAQPASDDEWLTPQCELAAVRLIANRTNVVGKLILYPVYVLLLLMIARYPLFDAWQFPLPLLITAGLVLFGLLAHSWRLRYLANEAKGNILARVRTLLTDAIEETTHQREQLKQLLDAIDKERAGAFRPWGEDYLIRALAIPLAGQGGFVLIDQLMSSMR